MIKDLINEFRRQNGRHPAIMNHREEDQNCLWHCLHMSRIREVCHAPDCFREGKSEVCAARSFFHTPQETLRAIIFEQLANSPEHRDILLFNDNIACADCISEYFVFVTIRGW